jgi:ribonuclease P protein component
MPPRNGLSKRQRLLNTAAFQRAYDRRCTGGDDWLLVFAVENDLPFARVGLSVGRKWGAAPVRNRVKRLYREAFRLSKGVLPTGVDLVLVPRRVEGLTLAQVRRSLQNQARRAAERLARSPRGGGPGGAAR